MTDRNEELREPINELILMRVVDRLATELEKHYPQPIMFTDIEDVIENG
jgi:hypothetical protein